MQNESNNLMCVCACVYTCQGFTLVYIMFKSRQVVHDELLPLLCEYGKFLGLAYEDEGGPS